MKLAKVGNDRSEPPCPVYSYANYPNSIFRKRRLQQRQRVQRQLDLREEQLQELVLRPQRRLLRRASCVLRLLQQGLGSQGREIRWVRQHHGVGQNLPGDARIFIAILMGNFQFLGLGIDYSALSQVLLKPWS